MKQCPFCGNCNTEMMRSSVGHSFWRKCKDCKAEGPIGMDEEEANALWEIRNTSPPEK